MEKLLTIVGEKSYIIFNKENTPDGWNGDTLAQAGERSIRRGTMYHTLAEQIGVTDEVTTCNCCGKENLMRTVVFRVKEEYRTEMDDYAFLGTACAVNVTRGRSIKKVKVNARGLTEYEAEIEAEQEKFRAFVRVNTARQLVKNGWSLPTAWNRIRQWEQRIGWFDDAYKNLRLNGITYSG